MLTRPGQLIEEGGFAAVLIADKGKGKRCSFRQRITAALRVELAFFAKTGMQGFLFFFLCGGVAAGTYSGNLLHVDAGGIIKPERQFITVEPELHGIAHGGVFDDSDFGAGDDPHVKKMLAKCAFAADPADQGRFSKGQFF